MKSLQYERQGVDDLEGYWVEHLWEEREWEGVVVGTC